jgi:hypothetical protein
MFKEKECVQKVFKLLNKPEIEAQTCFNGLTCLQAMMGLSEFLVYKIYVKETLHHKAVIPYLILSMT